MSLASVVDRHKRGHLSRSCQRSSLEVCNGRSRNEKVSSQWVGAHRMLGRRSKLQCSVDRILPAVWNSKKLSQAFGAANAATTGAHLALLRRCLFPSSLNRDVSQLRAHWCDRSNRHGGTQAKSCPLSSMSNLITHSQVGKTKFIRKSAACMSVLASPSKRIKASNQVFLVASDAMRASPCCRSWAANPRKTELHAATIHRPEHQHADEERRCSDCLASVDVDLHARRTEAVGDRQEASCCQGTRGLGSRTCIRQLLATCALSMVNAPLNGLIWVLRGLRREAVLQPAHRHEHGHRSHGLPPELVAR